jgi:predicted dehydrogenase
MLKIGVFGAGHLGKIHIQQWLQLPQVEVVGFVDPNDKNAEEAIQLYGVKRFDTPDELLNLVDAADIVAPTTSHYVLAEQAIKHGKHIFIEKPITNTLEEARELVKLVNEANIKCQIGHVERFNPAFLALKNQEMRPMFIEVHRLAQFNPRGTDVSVILDLMIHDIDIVLSLVKAPVRRISASGVSVISDATDIANARIEFDNGCVANLTSSRISLKKMRKMRLFQKDAYIGMDFLEKKTEIVQLKNPGEATGFLDFPIDIGNGQQKIISIQNPNIPENNAIRMELELFANSVLNNTPVTVSAEEGLMALDVAYQILKKINAGTEQQPA